MALSRGKITDVVFDRLGNAQAGASINVYAVGTTTPVNVYAAQAGGSPLTQPLSTDLDGTFEFWAAPGAVDVKMSGIPTLANATRLYFVPAVIGELAPAADAVMTNATITGGLLTNVTFVSPTGVLTPASLANLTVTGGTYESFYDKGSQVFNIAAYGALGVGDTDETNAIDDCYDDAVAASRAGRAAFVWWGPGRHRYNRPFTRLDDTYGVTMQGTGSNSCWLALYPRGDHWAGMPQAQIAGGFNHRWRGIGILQDQASELPDCGLLIAQNAAHTPNVNAWPHTPTDNQTNAIEIWDARHEGQWLKAAFAAVSAPSMAVYETDFYLHGKLSDSANNLAGTAVIVLTAKNPMGFQAWADNIAGNDYPMLTSGGAQISDLSFRNCEVHDQRGEDLIAEYIASSGARGIAPGTWTLGSTWRIDEVYSLVVDGANSSGGSDTVFRFTGGTTDSPLLSIGCRNILIQGHSIYPEGANASPPKYAFNLTSPEGGVSNPSHRINQLTVRNCEISLWANAAAAVFRGVAGSQWDDVEFQQCSLHSSFVGSIVDIPSTGATFNRPKMNGLGKAFLNPGGTINAARGLVNFSTITGTVTGRDPLDVITTQGDTIAATAAGNFTRIAKGTAYQLYRMNSGATAPEFATMPYVSVFNNANISVGTSGSPTTLTFNSERADTEGIHSTGSNTDRLTCVTPGSYLVTACIQFASNATGYRTVEVVHSSSGTVLVERVPAVNGNATVLSVAGQVQLTAGQYVTVQATQTSGGALNVENSGSHSPRFELMWIGP